MRMARDDVTSGCAGAVKDLVYKGRMAWPDRTQPADPWRRPMRSIGSFSLLVAADLLVAGCLPGGMSGKSVVADRVVADKPFASAGQIAMQLDGGAYEVRAADGDR